VAGHCCIKAKGVLAVPQSGDAGPSDTLENVTNRAFECLLGGFWAGEWITSGDPNAQCNSAAEVDWGRMHLLDRTTLRSQAEQVVTADPPRVIRFVVRAEALVLPPFAYEP
jgi:hypothetical protein